MENKINVIEKLLEGETISDCLTILQKVKKKINDIEFEEKQKIIFKT